MADQQLRASQTSAAPLSYTVPGAAEIILKALRATFDGTAAGSAFLPAIEIIAPGGASCGVFPTDTVVAAGGSADVSFAPFLRGESSGTGSGVGVEHNGTLIAVEDNIDFEDAGVTWTVTDDAANSRVKVSGSGGGSANAWCWLHSVGTTNPLAYDRFTTSDTAIFSTSTAGAPTVVSNTSGDKNLILGADGLYLLHAWAIIIDTVSGTERWINPNPSGNVAPLVVDASLAWGTLAQLGTPIPSWFNSNFAGGGASPGLFALYLVRIDSTISGGVKYWNWGFGTTGTISSMNFQGGAFYWPASTGVNKY